MADIYSNQSRYCVVIVSRSYLRKVWTRHESRALGERALFDQDYIIPVRADDTEITGLFNATTAYLPMEKGIDKIVETINKKLWVNGTQQKKFYR